MNSGATVADGCNSYAVWCMVQGAAHARIRNIDEYCKLAVCAIRILIAKQVDICYRDVSGFVFIKL